jgi:thymidylate synthase
MKAITVNTIGEAWIEACRCIFKYGNPMKDDDKDIKELLHLFVTIKRPGQNDIIIEKYGDTSMIDWMMSNFLEQKRVPELKNSLSYGTRLFNYNGKNQVLWAIEALRKKPEAKSVTIPMIMPNQDSGYIPCVSMLDFKIRNNKLIMVAMCRSIDFGKKVYANMLALNRIQHKVAKEVNVSDGELIMYIVSAHIDNEDYKMIEGILDESQHT